MPSYLEWGYHSIIRFLCGDYAGAIEAGDRAQGAHKNLERMACGRALQLGHREPSA
jgi:hypothetical protein